MQFKYPEVFYFLFVLIIPIIVHLFQLQKFNKVAFTNVAFLKKISLETRKSSKLKKWLILTSRMLGLIAILFTFSQPYFSNKKAEYKNHNIIYLDNSMSLNTNGTSGNKLKMIAQEIIKNASESDLFTVITNDDSYLDMNKKELDNLLKNISFSAKTSDLSLKIIEIQGQNKNKTNTLYKNILISDFQIFEKNKIKEFTNVKHPISLVKVKNQQENNISVDSIHISKNTNEEFTISVTVKNQGNEKKNIPIALYNDSKLISKRSFSIGKDLDTKIEFTVPKATNFLGRIEITYNDIFLFDNTFYFNINSQQKVSVLSIGKQSGSLNKIFSENNFQFQASDLRNINYNSIPDQQLIVLNELEIIPDVLQNSLLNFIKNGGHLLIIPHKEIQTTSYNTFFKKINSGKITSFRKDSLKITTINYQHKLYADVFSKQVSNFQYPTVSLSYETSLTGDKIISYENKLAFLQEIENPFSKVYWFTSPLDLETTNFSNSPLIVPTLFNIGQLSLEVSSPYYTLHMENNIEVLQKLDKDEILTMTNTQDSFIPLQQSFANKVRLKTSDLPKTAGFYSILKAKDTLQSLAYNYANTESLLSFYDVSKLKKENPNIEIYESIEELFAEINEKNEVQWLWKLFLAIAIVSLLLEILILKFFKP